MDARIRKESLQCSSLCVECVECIECVECVVCRVYKVYRVCRVYRVYRVCKVLSQPHLLDVPSLRDSLGQLALSHPGELSSLSEVWNRPVV